MDILEKCVMFICTVGEVDDTWETQLDPDNSTVYDKLSGWDTMEEQLVVGRWKGGVCTQNIFH